MNLPEEWLAYWRASWIASVVIASLMIAFATAPRAQERSWPVADMNRTIENANFRVGNGCSGTLISVPRKLVLTNAHCVQGEVKIVDVDEIAEDGTVRKVKRQIRLPTTVAQDVYDALGRVIGRRESRVEIIRVNSDVDLALLKVLGPIASTMAAPILPEQMTVSRGERVYSVGNPAGYEATVVEGIVSSIRRELADFSSPLGKPWEGMQISGGIWGGNSGGAVYNASGYLIGVPAIGHVRATFIGFAVPIDVIHAFLAKACHADLFSGANASDCPR